MAILMGQVTLAQDHLSRVPALQRLAVLRQAALWHLVLHRSRLSRLAEIQLLVAQVVEQTSQDQTYITLQV